MAQNVGTGPFAPLSEMFLKSLYALADAGQAEAACRFAGHAYVLLRQSHPAEARHFDVLLHRLTPKLNWHVPPRAPGSERVPAKDCATPPPS